MSAQHDKSYIRARECVLPKNHYLCSLLDNFHLLLLSAVASSNFIDYVKIYCRSGHGGAGSMHFRREKFVPLGGPDGGNGGRGGHIILRGNRQLWTLLHLQYTKHIHAEDGQAGSGQQCSGRQGEDQVIEVPLGTVVRDAETGDQLLEITEQGQEVILLHGGRGGLGNMNFATSTNQAPMYAQPGEEHQERWVILELKVLADVGLVGFPNAGKSTLLSVVSAAKPKIADYPFTTLIPNLGVVKHRGFTSFVMADIPGIIEGAAEGKGLGLRFLRHIERNALLLFLIPVDTQDLRKEYEILLGELEQYNPELLDKQRIVAVTKIDMLDDELTRELLEQMDRDFADVPHIAISSVAQKNIEKLKDLLWTYLQEQEVR